MKRYNNIDYIMQMDIEDGIELIKTAFKEDTKDKLYQMYVIKSAFMTKDNYISFDDYFKQCTKPVINNRIENKEEIYNKVNNILEKVCKQ